MNNEITSDIYKLKNPEKSKYQYDNSYFENPIDFNGIELKQFGRLYCNADTVIAPHLHPDLFELTAVTDGVGKIVTNGIARDVKSGDIYLSFPYDLHEIITDKSNPLKFDYMAFTNKKPEFEDDLYNIKILYHSPEHRVFSSERILQLMNNIATELNRDKKFATELVCAFLQQILIYTIRSFNKITTEKYPRSVSEPEIVCYKIMNYIDTHIYEMNSLEELADIFGYSYGYLSVLFKNTVNITLSDYYRKKRLETAKILISEGNLRIKQIAEKLQYSSQYSFSKAFKNLYGISPRNFKDKNN